MSEDREDASFPNIETISQSVSKIENETSNNVINNNIIDSNVVEGNYNTNDSVYDKKLRDSDRTLNNLYEVRCKVNNNLVDLLLDTGPSHSLLKVSKAQVALGRNDVTLISATGGPIMVKGTTNVTLGVNEKQVNLTLEKPKIKYGIVDQAGLSGPLSIFIYKLKIYFFSLYIKFFLFLKKI